MRIRWLMAALLLVCTEQAAVAKLTVKQQGDLLFISNGLFDIGYDLHINKLGVRWDGEEVIKNGVVGSPPALPSCGTWERTDTADGATITIRPDESGRFDFSIMITETSSHFELSRASSSNANTFSGIICLSRDQWPARLQRPDKEANVIQMGSGRTTSLLCDGVYDRRTFKAIRISDTTGNSPDIKPREDSAAFAIPIPRAKQGTVKVELKRDIFGEKAAEARSQDIIRKRSRLRCGWSSSSCFGPDVSQEQVISNLEFAARHLAPYGLEYIQIDDGWQVLHAGDWEPNEKFPNGMKWLADRIHEKGLKAGLWMPRFSDKATSQWNYDYINMRNIPDTKPDWMSIVKNSHELAKTYCYHRSLRINEPDCLVVRHPLTEDQARIWASLLALTGSKMVASDDMPSLPPDRLDIVKKVIPVADIHPMDLFEHDLPEIWNLKIQADWGQWDVAAIVNWEETEKKVEMEFGDLGLPAHTDYLVYDFWQDTLIGKSRKGVPLTIPAGTSRLLVIQKYHPRPQLLSSSRHVTQGLVDIKELRWDGLSSLLSGTVQGVALERTVLTFHLPANYRVLSYDCTGAAVTAVQDGNLFRLVFRFNSAKPATWSICFGT